MINEEANGETSVVEIRNERKRERKLKEKEKT